MKARNTQRVNKSAFTKALAFAGATALGLAALPTSAEITEDCILEGTVDMQRAKQLGQPVYVRFRNAENGSEARCSLNQRSRSRRVKFVSSPDTSADLSEDVQDGSKVRYRYTERNNEQGNWELIDVRGF